MDIYIMSMMKLIVIFKGRLIINIFNCGIVWVMIFNVKLIRNKLVIIGVDIWKVIINIVLKFFVIK